MVHEENNATGMEMSESGRAWMQEAYLDRNVVYPWHDAFSVPSGSV